MYATYGNIYHQYTPVLLAYIPYMDPMGLVIDLPTIFFEILLTIVIPYLASRKPSGTCNKAIPETTSYTPKRDFSMGSIVFGD